MMPRELLNRRALFNFGAGVMSLILAGHLLMKFLMLRSELRYSGTGFTLLMAVIIFALMAAIYIGLAILMKFRYMLNMPSVDAKCLWVLRYGEGEFDFKLVWYRRGLWIISSE